jgi:hypothetical protein
MCMPHECGRMPIHHRCMPATPTRTFWLPGTDWTVTPWRNTEECFPRCLTGNRRPTLRTSLCQYGQTIAVIIIFFYHDATALVGQGLFIVEDSWSHSDTPHSVGLPWTSDRPIADTSTWQHTTLKRDKHPCPGGIRTHNPSNRAAADRRIRPCFLWHWR